MEVFNNYYMQLLEIMVNSYNGILPHSTTAQKIVLNNISKIFSDYKIMKTNEISKVIRYSYILNYKLIYNEYAFNMLIDN